MDGARPNPTRLIALMNQKGGVGKTTTTVTLAAAYARAGRSTLVVDLDPQAHATLHLGVDPASIQTSVYDVLLDPASGLDGRVHSIAPNLDLLPAHTDLAAAEIELSQAPDRNRRLTDALARAAGTYEFVLFDCPPSLGLLTLNGLVAAREVIIPMQAHFLALQGVGKLLETVRLVTQSVNPKLRVTGVVLCMHDTSSTHTQEVVADLEAFLAEQRSLDVPWKHARVLRPAIRRNIKLAECPSFGQTIFDYAPTAPGAADYKALAEGMLREWDAMLERRAEAKPETKPETKPDAKVERKPQTPPRAAVDAEPPEVVTLASNASPVSTGSVTG
jgi:chromosome partitioning protein